MSFLKINVLSKGKWNLCVSTDFIFKEKHLTFLVASVIEKLANLNLIMALSQNLGKIIQTLEIK